MTWQKAMGSSRTFWIAYCVDEVGKSSLSSLSMRTSHATSPWLLCVMLWLQREVFVMTLPLRVLRVVLGGVVCSGADGVGPG